MSKIVLRSILLLSMGLFAANCASVTSEPESISRIESDPPGASCRLENEKGFRRDIVTPTSVTLHRELAPITIACTSPGHRALREEIQMDGNPMVAGNILIGGLIGIAVDAASGASQKFPSLVTVLLDPSEFETIAERDQWYEKRKARLLAAYQKQYLEIEGESHNCKNDIMGCQDKLEALEQTKEANLAKLQKLRSTALVRTPGAVIKQGNEKTCLVQISDTLWENRPCPK